MTQGPVTYEPSTDTLLVELRPWPGGEPSAPIAGGEDEGGRSGQVNTIANLSRRDFLKTTALAGGGLILGVHLPGVARAAEEPEQRAASLPLNAFVSLKTLQENLDLSPLEPTRRNRAGRPARVNALRSTSMAISLSSAISICIRLSC